MRRKDREITDVTDIESIVQACDVCRLAFTDGNIPYIVPMNFGYLYDGNWTLYFHCAATGKKLELMQHNPQVAFEMDCNHTLIPGTSLACQCGMAYSSVMGNGVAQIVLEPAEKRRALSYIMAHYGQEVLPFEESMIARTTVFQVWVTSITGKSRKN